MSTWLLVANASRARLFATQARPRTLTLLEEFSHPQSREKNEDLSSDRPGHFQTTSQGMDGANRGAFAEPTNPKDYEHERFAAELAEHLNEGRTSNRYDNLMLVASPHFLGLLNQQLNEHVAKLATVHVSKDYTALDEAALVKKLDPLA
ncbi:host attachment protein [Haliea sp.]